MIRIPLALTHNGSSYTLAGKAVQPREGDIILDPGGPFPILPLGPQIDADTFYWGSPDPDHVYGDRTLPDGSVVLSVKICVTNLLSRGAVLYRLRTSSLAYIA